MASSRRPPPPPPKDPSPPPPLPSRNGTTGNRQLMEPIHPTHSLPGVSVGVKKFMGTMPEDEHTRSQSDDIWDMNTYTMPDGGMIQDEYNMPDDIQVPTNETIKQPINVRIPLVTPRTDLSSIQSSSKLPAKVTANGSSEDKKKKTEIKSCETNVPKPPPKKTNLVDQYKPVPKPKPLKSSDPTFLKLPPRPMEKPLPIITPVPPLGSVDVTCTGSVPSGLVICPSNKEKVTGKIAANKHQEVKSLPSVTDTPVSEVLSRFDWFHGELEREEGAKRVKQLSENGTFLIRASKTDGTNNSHLYTLVVTLDHKVYNLKIRLRPDGYFAIGNYKPDEVSFSTVPELVEHHKENNIKLSEGGAVKLTYTPKK